MRWASKTDSTDSGSYKIRNYAFDLVAKASMPLSQIGMDNFSVFGKAGVARLVSKRSSHEGAKRNTGFTYSAGISWKFMPEWTADFTYQRFLGETDIHSHDYQPNMDAYTVGITYHIDTRE